MKKVIYIFLLMLIVSCSKEKDTDDTSVVIPELKGTWEWVSSSGGIAGSTLTLASTGVFKYIYIGDNVISFYENGVQKEAKTFVIQSKKSIYSHKAVPMMVFKNHQNSFELKENILVLKDEVCDGFMHLYRKKDNMPCNEIFKTLTVTVKNKKGKPVALDKIEVKRLDTNKDITSKLVGSEWVIHQKWGSYPVYNDLFVKQDKGKSLTVNLKGYVNENQIVNTNIVVGADDCHIFYVSGNRNITIDE